MDPLHPQWKYLWFLTSIDPENRWHSWHQYFQLRRNTIWANTMKDCYRWLDLHDSGCFRPVPEPTALGAFEGTPASIEQMTELPNVLGRRVWDSGWGPGRTAWPCFWRRGVRWWGRAVACACAAGCWCSYWRVCYSPFKLYNYYKRAERVIFWVSNVLQKARIRVDLDWLFI